MLIASSIALVEVVVGRDLLHWKNKARHHWRQSQRRETEMILQQWQSCIFIVCERTLSSKMTTGRKDLAVGKTHILNPQTCIFLKNVAALKSDT